ncbi:MAG: DedA family protein [Candidatus Omnitrophica bacterium]|nr:DedA family protein [Candidatus Omnitrophota bacterium]
MLKSFTKWTLDKFLPMGPLGLFMLSFAESSFFPIPPDILLIALALITPESSFFLALITTIGSVLGAIFGYFVGLKGGRPLLEKFVSKEKISLVHNYFNKYEAWAIGIAGFTPIPYKVFTISAGVFYINFTRFIIASILSRGARFFLVGGAIYLFGDTIKLYIEKYFNLFTIAFVLLLVLGFVAIKLFSKIHAKKTKN